MKKTLLAVALFASCAAASAQIAMPGSNWSSLTYNPSPIRGPEDNNLLLQGNIEQGIVWKQFDNGWRLNTYAALGYSADKNGLSYNNKLSPAIGVKFQRPWENGVVDVGVQVVHQRNFRGINNGNPRSGTGVQLYVQYWMGWDLKK